jgi:hypothetical protein
MPHPEETCQLFAQYAHVSLGSDSHEDNMVNMAGEFHEDVEDSQDYPYTHYSEIQSHNRGAF